MLRADSAVSHASWAASAVCDIIAGIALSDWLCRQARIAEQYIEQKRLRMRMLDMKMLTWPIMDMKMLTGADAAGGRCICRGS